MSHKYASDIELIHQIGILENLTGTLVSQTENLAKLRTEGKVSDSALGEFSKELIKRAEVITQKNEELLPAADLCVKQMNSASANLKYQLELLEVGHAIDSIADDVYKIIREGITTQLAEIEQARKRINQFTTGIPYNLRRVGQYLSGIVVEMPKEVRPIIEPMEAAVRSVEPDMKPIGDLIAELKLVARPDQEQRDKTKPSVKKCSRCQSENLESASYCFNCGTEL